MKAKAYLMRLKDLDQHIENMRLEIDNLYCLAESVTIQPKEVDVQTSSSGDKMAQIVGRIVDTKKELETEIERFVNLKLEAIKLINKLDDPVHANILLRRYVYYEEWQDIADMLGKTRQTIDTKHGKALLEFDMILHNLH